MVSVSACDGTVCVQDQTSMGIDDGAWHQVAVVRQQHAPLIVYIDCQLALKSSAFTTLQSDLGSLGFIAIGSSALSSFHPISLSNIQLFSSALDESFIGSAPCSPNAVMCFPLLNDSRFAIGVVSDASGYNNFGLIEGQAQAFLQPFVPIYHTCPGGYEGNAYGNIIYI